MIYELSSDHFQRAAPVYADVWFDRSSIDSVLAGQRAGRVFVDDPSRPSAALLFHHIGNNYPAGEVSGALLSFIRETPAEPGVFSIPFIRYYAASAAWEQAILDGAPAFVQVTPRRTFVLEDCAQTPFANWRDLLPPGVEIRRIDRALAKRVDRELSDQYIGPVWHEDGFAPDRYPAAGYDNFVRKSVGFCALMDGKIVSAAWAGSLSDGHIDVEIETADGYRGRGLATLTCAALLEECAARGLASEWICDTANLASGRLALRLGHRELPPVKNIAWRGWGQDFTPSEGLWTGEPLDCGRLWRRI